MAHAAAAGGAHELPPPGAGGVDYRPEVRRRRAGGAGDREPAVAAPHGPGHRGDPQRLRHARHATRPSRAARLPGFRINHQRLAFEGNSQAYSAQRRLPDKRAERHRQGRGGSGQPVVLAPPGQAAGSRGRSRRDAVGVGGAGPDDVRPRHARPGVEAAERLLHRQAQPVGPDDGRV